jgi:hypothetical protein
MLIEGRLPGKRFVAFVATVSTLCVNFHLNQKFKFNQLHTTYMAVQIELEDEGLFAKRASKWTFVLMDLMVL